MKARILKQEGQIRYKVHLLQKESTRILYERRLTRYLNKIVTHFVIDTEWENVKQCIHKAVYEVLGKSLPYKRNNGLKICNEEIAQAVQEKKKAYLVDFQKKSDASRENYKEKRRTAKALVRKADKDSLESFVTVGSDMHGREDFAGIEFCG